MQLHLNDITRLVGTELRQEIEQIKIPNTPLQFFKDHIGAIKHPRTGKPSQPFGYQYRSSYPYIRHKKQLKAKSHKIGMSTWDIIVDLWKAYYQFAGFDILVTSQKFALAKEHLREARRFLRESKTLRKTVLYQGPLEMRDERTKVESIYVQSPLSSRASRLIAVPFSVTSLESWMRVGHVHASDVAVNKYREDAEVFGAMFSRVATTDGTITIETIPGGQRGTVYNLWRDDPYIWKKAFPYDLGVQAGLITEEFIEEERKRWGMLFPALYEAVFLPSLNAAYPASLADATFSEQYDLEF